MTTDEDTWRIGALAESTGLTVRTLRYYDQIGLLSPVRQQGGHRAYTGEDVHRLYQICTLRRLGLPLARIGQALDDQTWDLPSALAVQLADLEQRLEVENRVHSRLTRLLADREPDLTSATDLLELLEDITMIDTGLQRRISIVVYADMQAAYDYLVRCFGFGPGELNHDSDGRVVHAELQAGDGVLWLHGETADFGLASPRTLGAATGMVAVLVDDVDAHYEHARAQGASIRYEPVDQPYGYREYGALDCEGHLWSFMKPLG